MAKYQTLNKDLPFKLQIDRSLMFYLSAKTGKTLEECACIMVDMANRSIGRMRNDECWRNSRNRFTFPKTDLKMNATVSKGIDTVLFEKDALEWIRRLAEQPFMDKNFKRTRIFTYGKFNIWGMRDLLRDRAGAEAWVDSNPYPNRNEYETLICTVSMMKKDNTISLYQEDIDNYLIEKILLGEEDGEE